jgi:hypothetical protein
MYELGLFLFCNRNNLIFSARRYGTLYVGYRYIDNILSSTVPYSYAGNPEYKNVTNFRDPHLTTSKRDRYKYFFSVADPGSGAFLTQNPGSGKEKFVSGIRDKYPGSATLEFYPISPMDTLYDNMYCR